MFATARLRAIELTSPDIPRLQEFFELNPEYFFTVNGEGPVPGEAHEEMLGSTVDETVLVTKDDDLPAGWPYTRKWIIGFEDDAGSLVGMANVVSDLLAPGIWHIGLFMVATTMHGSGEARDLYQQLENWAHRNGAQWLRLGVVIGNARAEWFWERNGFVEVRTREGVEMGKRTNSLRVMSKALAGGSVAEYLLMVARDRPEAN